VYDTSYDEPFKTNIDLDLGSEATWTVDDILQPPVPKADIDPEADMGPKPKRDMIFDFVKRMLVLNENIEGAIKQNGL
jgi:hypothetical protein